MPGSSDMDEFGVNLDLLQFVSDRPLYRNPT
jgi:hypothetical protein